jgi:uncharacterized protein YggE
VYYHNVHQKPFGVSRVISVTGHGNVSAIPDYVQLQVEVITKGKEVSKATQDNAETTSHVIQSILALGIEREDIQTASYTISPKYDYIDGKQLFRGYEVTNAISVKVRNISQVGTLIDTAVKNGANSMSGLQFKLENPDFYYQRALIIAYENAQMKANTIAETMHLHMPPQPIEIVEESMAEPVLFKTAMANQNITTPIETGLITISAVLRVKFRY